tara:strand:+ start:1491 stop:1850 length:360 start_codon:yes stop_codon:yes gene_type:complete
MKCDCDCHTKKNESDLKSCKERGKIKDKEIARLNKKIMALTIAIAIGGTLIGKKTLDEILSYFEQYDKVKQAIEKSISLTDEPLQESFDNGFAGVSVLPSPSAIAVFGLPLLMPCKRRR